MILRSLDEINRSFIIEQTAQAAPIAELAAAAPEPGGTAPEAVIAAAPEAVIAAAPDAIPTESLSSGEAERIQGTSRRGKGKKKDADKRSSKFLNALSDIIFYTAILMIFLQIITTGGLSNTPKTLLGHSFFTVLSSSMQDEIPRGSLIIVRQKAPDQLQVGDNITYMRDSSTSVTHKIVGIYENFQETGARGFQTKGVNNANADPTIVPETSIVGKVSLVIPLMGALISALSVNFFLLFVLFGLSVILSFCLRGVFAKTEKKRDAQHSAC